MDTLTQNDQSAGITLGGEFMIFEIERFVGDCRVALTADNSYRCVREVVARAVSCPASILGVLGEPKRGALQTLYHSRELTILNVVWAPHVTRVPHNHEMWAVIGVYTGHEDNIFWRRVPDQRAMVKAVGGRSLGPKDAMALGRHSIHSVTNPHASHTGAIHVYGGDFFGAPGRSEWDPETLLEHPWNTESLLRRFEISTNQNI